MKLRRHTNIRTNDIIKKTKKFAKIIGPFVNTVWFFMFQFLKFVLIKEGGCPSRRPFCFVCLNIAEFLVQQTNNTGSNFIILFLVNFPVKFKGSRKERNNSENSICHSQYQTNTSGTHVRRSAAVTCSLPTHITYLLTYFLLTSSLRLSSTSTSAWDMDTRRLFNKSYHKKTEENQRPSPPEPLRPSRTTREYTRPVTLKFIFLILSPHLRLGLTGVFSFGLPD